MSCADHSPLASPVIAVALALAGGVAMAADAAATKNPAPAKPATAPREVKLPKASPDQEHAAALVHHGIYDCEFNQKVNVVASTTHPFYVDVKHGQAAWLMKPVVSPTGAVRLEDVKGETLMLQIASKSMLLNVKTQRRIVDACISARHRELHGATTTSKPAGGTSPPRAGTVPTPTAPSGASAASK
jgi:hypothetical protein